MLWIVNETTVGQTHYKIIYIWENIVHGIKLKRPGLTLGHTQSLTLPLICPINIRRLAGARGTSTGFWLFLF